MPVLILLVGCSIVGTQERRLIVLNGGSIDHRAQVAQEYVTDERLRSLRVSVRTRFSSVTEKDLAGLELSWQRLVTAGKDAVVVVVTFTPQSKNVDANAIADYCADQVGTDFRERLWDLTKR